MLYFLYCLILYVITVFRLELNLKENMKAGTRIQQYDAVLMDLDETLFEFRFSSRNGLEQVKKGVECLSGIETTVLEDELWNLDRHNLPLVFSGTITPREYRKIRLRRLIMLHGYMPSENEMEKIETVYVRAFESRMKMCDGARELLEFCYDTGKPTAIITNGDRETQLKTIRKLRIDKLIDMILTPKTQTEMKPNTPLFDHAISTFDTKRERSVMIGDSWTHDVMGAINSGIKAVWVNRKNEAVPRTVNILEVKTVRELI